MDKDCGMNVTYVSVWDGGTAVKTAANINTVTGEVYDVAHTDVEGLNMCEREYVVLSGIEVTVYPDERGFALWADIKNEYASRKENTMINKFSNLLGYEKTLPLEYARKAVDQLSELYLFTLWDNAVNDVGKEVISEAEFIAYCLQTGRMPGTSVDRKCYKCHKNGCGGKASCPDGKTVYSIGDEGFGMYITKTGYDFAGFLIASGLTTFDKVQAVIDGEKPQDDGMPQKHATPESARQTAEDTDHKNETEYSAWLHERMKNYGASNVLEAAKRRILREIYLNMLWKYDDYFDLKLLVLIDGIEKTRCRRDLIHYLKSSGKAGLTVFECVTGISLPKSSEEREKLLEKTMRADYILHPQEYVPRKSADNAGFSDRFYMLCKRGDSTNGIKGFIESRAKLWRYNGTDFFIQKEAGGTYKISEGRTGLKVNGKFPTVESGKEAIISKLEELGEQFYVHIDNAVQQSGVSPLYAMA